MLHLPSFLSFCSIAVITTLLLLKDVTAQSTTVIGGTTITMSANPVGVPTLAYNCAKLPAICNNVNANGGQYALTDLGNNLKGRLSTVPFVVMHSDTDADRRKARRDSVCPSSGNNAWKNTHTCPEPDQPLVVPAPFNVGGEQSSTMSGRHGTIC